MQQWEYLFATVQFVFPQNNSSVIYENGVNCDNPIDYSTYLTSKGEEGWELISENIEHEEIKKFQFRAEIINNYKIEDHINLYIQKFNSDYLGSRSWKIVNVLQCNDSPGWTKLWIVLFSCEITEHSIKRRLMFKRQKNS